MVITYRQKYKIIRPYINFRIINFNKVGNKRRISLYYNSLKRYITEHSTSTSIKDTVFTRSVLKTLKFNVPIKGLSRIPVPPYKSNMDIVIKHRLYIKKNYFILSSKNITLYTTPMDPIKLALNPSDTLLKSMDKLPVKNGLFYTFLFFRNITSYGTLPNSSKTKVGLLKIYQEDILLKYQPEIVDNVAGIIFK